MSDDKLYDKIHRGARADALMKDELLQEAFAQLERTYMDAWKISLDRETEGRERVWNAVQIISKVKDHLIAYVRNGKVAQAELNELLRRKAA